jgi:S1-C subfamily serine protease
VGVNTAVAGIGLGLAVPINASTRGIISSLMTEGRVRRAWLGIGGAQQPLPPIAVREFGHRSGLLVSTVVPQSPAAKGGLRAGDLVVTVDGANEPSATGLQKLMGAEAIGRPMAITVLRNGKPVSLTAVPSELDEGT